MLTVVGFAFIVLVVAAVGALASGRLRGLFPGWTKTVVRLVIPIVLIVGACWLVWRWHGYPPRGIDDAQITFSYSSNLATGRGFTYANNGERVEGFTSLLWTLVCALPFRLGFGEAGVLAIAVMILCLTQILVLDLIRRLTSARRLSTWPFELAYLFIVFTCPAYFTWMSITLMDTCLWGLIVVLMLYAVLLPPRSSLGDVLAVVPFCLATLTRPEAMLVAPAIIVLAWLRSSSDGWFTLRLAIAFLASTAAVTLFRLLYFGYPLPNTYYAKVSPSLTYNLQAGRDYLYAYITKSGPIIAVSSLFLTLVVLWLVGVLIGKLLPRLRTQPKQLVHLADWELTTMAAAILLVIPVLSGGDHFDGFRFYQAAYPIVALSAVLFLAASGPANIVALLASRSRAMRDSIPLCLVLFGVAFWAMRWGQVPSWQNVRDGKKGLLQNEFRLAEEGIKVGQNLKSLLSGTGNFPSIGVITAGGIARTYPGRIVDLMGLNNLAIAHHPGDRKGIKNHAAFEKELFFRLGRIDVLLASPPFPPDTSSYGSHALKGLMFDPGFVNEWRYGELSSVADTNDRTTAFFLDAFLECLGGAGSLKFRETMTWRANRWNPVADTNEAEAPPLMRHVEAGRGQEGQ